MTIPFRAEGVEAMALTAPGIVSGVCPTDLYIDPLGDDTNDGLTPATPVASWARLFELIPDVIDVVCTVHMAAGTYPRLAPSPRYVASLAQLIFEGTYEVVYEGTPDAWVAYTDQLEFTGEAPGWTPDGLIGCTVISQTAPLSDYVDLYPVLSNTADTLTLAVPKRSSALANPVKIIRPLSIIDCVGETTFGGNVQFRDWTGRGLIWCWALGTANAYGYHYAVRECDTQVLCLACTGLASSYTNGYFAYVTNSRYTYFYGCQAPDPGVNLNHAVYAYGEITRTVSIRRCYWRARNAYGADGILLEEGAQCQVYGVRLENFDTGVRLQKNAGIANSNYADALFLGTCYSNAGIRLNSSGNTLSHWRGAANTLTGPWGDIVFSYNNYRRLTWTDVGHKEGWSQSNVYNGSRDIEYAGMNTAWSYPSPVQNISAATGVTPTHCSYGHIRVQSSTAGACVVTAVPQVAAGYDGQEIMLEGRDDTKTVEFHHGDGLSLKSGRTILRKGDLLVLKYNETDAVWKEVRGEVLLDLNAIVELGTLSGAVALDLTAGSVQKLTIDGDITLSATGLDASLSRIVQVFITASGTRNLAFDANWQWIGLKPTQLVNTYVGMLSIVTKGNLATDVVAGYELLGPGV